MKEIKQLLEASLKGLIWVLITFPFLAFSVLMIGIAVKVYYKIFMYSFNLL